MFVKTLRTDKSTDDLSWYQQLSKPARHLYRIIMDIHADDPQSFLLDVNELRRRAFLEGFDAESFAKIYEELRTKVFVKQTTYMGESPFPQLDSSRKYDPSRDGAYPDLVKEGKVVQIHPGDTVEYDPRQGIITVNGKTYELKDIKILDFYGG